MDTSKIPQYRCHKVVRALHIEAIVLNEQNRGSTLHFSEPGFDPYPISPEQMAKHSPRAPGVWVWYEDGYESYSPVGTFEAGYVPLGSAADIKEVAEELAPAVLHHTTAVVEEAPHGERLNPFQITEAPSSGV